MTELIRPERARGRGAGYCTTEECPEHLQLRAQPCAPALYRCSVCGQPGAVELERAVRSGQGPVVSEVRVEYAFDPRRAIYLERTCVRAARLVRSHARFTLQSPLIASGEVAQAVAATLLRRLSSVAHLARPERIDLAPPSRSALR